MLRSFHFLILKAAGRIVIFFENLFLCFENKLPFSGKGILRAIKINKPELVAMKFFRGCPGF